MSDIDSRLEAALRTTFYPLARVLLRAGVGIKPIIRIMKDAYVDAAINEHGKNGNPASISRTSQITGLTRAEIRKIRNDVQTHDHSLSRFAVDEAQLLAYWNSSPEFSSSDGKPKVLEPGPGPGTFSNLIEQSIGKGPIDEIVRNLEERGCAEVDADGRIRMLKREWHVGKDLPRLLRDTLGTLASTVDYNDKNGGEHGRCQRVAFTVRADPEKVVVNKRMLRSRIIRFIEEVDEQLTGIEVHSGDAEADLRNKELAKFGVGAYLFEIDSD